MRIKYLIQERISKFLFLLLIGISTPIWAQTPIEYVRISTLGDDEVFILLSEQPKVTTSIDGINIETEEENLFFSYDLGAKFEFVNPASVNTISNSSLKIDYKNQELKITGLNPDSSIIIYSLNGQIVVQGKTDNYGEWLNSTEGWIPGIYLVKTNKITFKLIIK